MNADEFEAMFMSAENSAFDRQEGGNHYAKLGEYQPWKVLAKWMTPEELKGAMKKEVITYLCREADKGCRLDIEKAFHTLQIYLELTNPSSNPLSSEESQPVDVLSKFAK